MTDTTSDAMLALAAKALKLARPYVQGNLQADYDVFQIDVALAAIQSRAAARPAGGDREAVAKVREMADVGPLECACNGVAENCTCSTIIQMADALLTRPAGAGEVYCGIVCLAAQADGVICADDECDRENGVRPAVTPEPSGRDSTREVPTCCVTGAIVGDGGACGDCDPCCMGEALVPDAVKRLIAEKNSLIDRNGELEDAAVSGRDPATIEACVNKVKSLQSALYQMPLNSGSPSKALDHAITMIQTLAAPKPQGDAAAMMTEER